MSLRRIEDLLSDRGVTVSYETIRQWRTTFGPQFVRRNKARMGSRGNRWFLDEVIATIRGKRRFKASGEDAAFSWRTKA
ncbi:MAG: IS6 family transposase [Chromatiales bacterium]|nr:IS6 family transposase [Chromatiales bacterium]